MLSDNTPVSFISDAPKSYLVDISGDAHPRYEIVWKLEDKEPEPVEVEAWIAKKGIAAKGKKCAERGEVKAVRFIEPLPDEQEEAPDSVMTGDESPEEPAAIPGKPESQAEPTVIPAVEPESAADLDDVPYLPGDLFEEPTLF